MKRALTEATIKEFIDVALDGCLTDVISDTGGSELCAKVSKEFITFMGHGAMAWFMVKDLHLVGYRLSPYLGGHHCVAMFGDTVYDFTARQFHSSMPFPYILELPETTMARGVLRDDEELTVFDLVRPEEYGEWEEWHNSIKQRSVACK